MRDASTMIDLGYRSSELRPERKSVQGLPFTVEHVSTPEGAGYDFAWTGTSAYLALHDIIVKDGVMSGDEVAPIGLLDMRQRMTFLPRGVRVNGWGEPARQGNSFVALYFDEDWLLDELEVAPKDRQLRPAVYFQDRRLSQCLARLGDLARARVKVPKAMGEAFMIMAGAELMRSLAPVASSAAGGLSADQLAAVREFVGANLDADIGVADLAAIVGQSVFHFTRQFMAAAGVTPYRFILEERIGRAKQIMRNKALSLADVAHLSGFHSASHFSKAFANIVGVSARAYRRGL